MTRATLSLLATLVLLAGCGQTTGPQSDSSVIGGNQHDHPARRAATNATGCHVHGSLPDPACTPGAASRATVSQVCVPGHTALVRNVPPVVKASVYRAYGITSHAAGSYEIDHLIPLELGGSNARANLWPERAPGYGRKDTLENAYHAAVCNGTLSFPVAQHRMARNWLRYAPPASKPAPPPPPPKPPPPSTSNAAGFCATHMCIPNFSNGHGSIVQCGDGEYSHSGGLSGACSRHGGVR